MFGKKAPEAFVPEAFVLSQDSVAQCVGAFFVQALIVQAGNTRFFGLFGKKSGPPFTNTEMSQRYLSLTTPAGYAFAIWAVIYLWEIAGMCFLAAGAAGKAVVPSAWPELQYLWLGACAAQSLWAFFFAFDALLPALSAIAILAGCLLKLAYELGPTVASMPDAYWYLVAPTWLHGGWVAAATLVNANLLFVEDRTDASVQIVFAILSFYAALTAGVYVLMAVGPSSFLMPSALAWALVAIRKELLHPSGPGAQKGHLRFGAGIPGLLPSDPAAVARHAGVAALGLAGAIGYMVIYPALS